MLGLTVLGLTSYMILMLIKNAIVLRHLNPVDDFSGSVELIIPVSGADQCFLDPWLNALKQFVVVPGRIKIHVLIDGHHSSMPGWQELSERLPYLQVHSFPMRPAGQRPIPWMLGQISDKVTADIIIVGDAELIPSERAFTSLGKLVSEKNHSFFVLPQTAKQGFLAEALAALNPALSLVSVIGLKRNGKIVAPNLLKLSAGWLSMPAATFRQFNFVGMESDSWKVAILGQLERDKQKIAVVLGEKQLLRYVPETPEHYLKQLELFWKEAWFNMKDRTAVMFYIVTILLWSMPVLLYFTRPLWALASFMLLVIYRFFTRIVFQESWIAFWLHPVGCIFLLISLIRFLLGMPKHRASQKQLT